MGIKELRDEYGKGGSSRIIVNRAIRAELPGGNELLDALEIVNQEPNRSEAISRVLELLREGREQMADEIARRYGLRESSEYWEE